MIREEECKMPLRLISAKETADRAGVTLRTIQRLVASGEAPAPVKVGKQRIGFYEHEVEAWLAALPRTRGMA